MNNRFMKMIGEGFKTAFTYQANEYLHTKKAFGEYNQEKVN